MSAMRKKLFYEQIHQEKRPRQLAAGITIFGPTKKNMAHFEIITYRLLCTYSIPCAYVFSVHSIPCLHANLFLHFIVFILLTIFPAVSAII